MTSSDPLVVLGEFLTADEAMGLAILLESGTHLNQALHEVSQARRSDAKSLLLAAGLSHVDAERAAAVLKGISGAKRSKRDSTLVWTMPGNEADVGHLTGEFYRLVSAARISVTCATYNFETTSKMWEVLKEASEQAGVVVVVYVDRNVVNTAALKAQLPKATIYQAAMLPTGKAVKSHAKFIVIDHEVTLLTSANFSFSAEKRNVELGLLVNDSEMSKSIEGMMASKHGSLYELV